MLVAALAPAAVWLATGPWPEARAQAAERYELRLEATPRDTSMRSTIKGRGAVEVGVDGRALSVSGRFEGLAGRATGAQLRMGHAVGVRGPAVHDLEVVATNADGTAGTIAGRVELGRQTFEALAQGRLYIQLDSEAAPDGNLWAFIYARR